MKKLFLILLAILCVCVMTGASATGMTTVSVPGLTMDIPSLPVSLTHAASSSSSYYGDVQYNYAWKFAVDENTVLQVVYMAYNEPLDYAQFAEDNRLADISGVEKEEASGHLCFYCTTEASNTFFLMSQICTAYYLDRHGVIILGYENDAVTDEEALADVKAMAASIQFTELPTVSTEEKVETAEAVTADAVTALLDQCRAENTTELDLTCSEALYAELSADKFSAMNRLCYEAGLEDFSLRYSDSRYYIELSSMTYTDVVSYVWVDTMEEAEAAAYGFVSEGLANFNLGCTGDVYTELLNNRGMYSLLAKLGIEDFDLRYSSTMLQVQNMKPFSGAWAIVSDIYSAADQLAAWHEQGLTHFTLVFGKDVLDTLSRDDLTTINFLGGIDEDNASSDSYGGFITYGHYRDVTWAEGQSVYCATEDDIVNTIKMLGAQGATTFRIMTTPELYETLSADSFARLHELEAQAGMSSSSMTYYHSEPIVVYTDAVIVADATMLSSIDEVIAYVDECVDRQDTEINLFLTADVYQELISGLSTFQIFKSNAKIFDLIANAGIANADTMYSRDSHIVTMKNMQLYAGTRILQAVENSTESALSVRDAEALAAARTMAADCAGATPLETLKNIHDALCEKIVYTDDESTDEDDCAIGAILTGEANCDGYADALYLIGRLAGLEVRYQHGDSVEQGLGSMFATHMWNMVNLDGTWRLVDVTWDDQKDSDPLYAWFNIGEDRAAKTHVWSHEMTVAMDPVTDPISRVEPEYTVTAEADVAAAVSDAAAKGYSVYYLYVSDDSVLDEKAVRSAARDAISDSFSYMWLDGLNALRIER